jgi:hypothetical protein
MTANSHNEKRVDARGIAAAGSVRVTGTQATASDHQTWHDWLRRGGVDEATIAQTATLTRDELIERLAAGGVDVTAYDLQNWQQAGIVPHGIRRRHHGATRLLYPWWMVDIIRTLREFQREERSLNRIAQILVIQAITLAKHIDDLPLPSMPSDIETQIRRWVDHHVATYGIPIRYAEISLVDERGHPLTFRFDMPE